MNTVLKKTTLFVLFMMIGLSSLFAATAQPYKHVVLQQNKTLHEQIRTTNTIYEIRYSFNLGGAQVNLPSNCVLKFDGGNITNGILNGRQTKIESTPAHIFDNVSIIGSWDVAESYVEWFGAIGDGQHDDGPAFRQALNSTFRVIKLLGTKVYGIGSYADEKNKIGLITFHDNTSIIGSNKGAEEKRSPQIKALPKVQFNTFLDIRNRTTILDGFQIYGNYKYSQSGLDGINVKTGLKAGNGEKMLGYLQIQNVEVGYVSGDAYNLSVFCSEFRNCLARYCDRGFVFDGKKSTVTSCLLTNCFVIASRHDAYYTYRTFYSNFIQCYADHCGYDHVGKSFDVKDISPVFHLVNSQGINMSGCGAEQVAKILLCQRANNVVITGCNYAILNNAMSDITIKYFEFDDCNSITHVGSNLFDTKNSKGRIKAKKSDNIAFIRCLYRYDEHLSNITRECIDSNSSFILLAESQDEVCTTKTRPVGLSEKEIGYRVFDSDLNKPIWWSKKGWVDANGNLVKNK